MVPSAREAGGPGGQVPASVVPTANDNKKNRVKDAFFILNSFQLFISVLLFHSKLYDLHHPSWMVLRQGACVVERVFIAQRNQGLDIFLQAERAPRGDRTETALGKIPAAKHVPGTICGGWQELCAQELYLGEI